MSTSQRQPPRRTKPGPAVERKPTLRKPEACRCPGCGRQTVQVLPAWCSCTQGAPLQFVAQTVLDASDAVLGKRP